jgi:hypothetical protein
MIRVKATFDTQALENLEAFVDQFADVAYMAFEETVAEIEPALLQELQDTPPKPTYPLRWASDKQRKFVMAKLRAEGNLPYRRTGKLAAAWTVDIDRNGSTFAMVVQNPATAAPFVYGSLAQNRTAALRFQQPFHQDTGWQAATDTVTYWQNALNEDFAKNLNKIASVEFKRRAFTRTR